MVGCCCDTISISTFASGRIEEGGFIKGYFTGGGQVCHVDGVVWMVSWCGHVFSSDGLHSLKNAFIHLDGIFAEISISGCVDGISTYCGGGIARGGYMDGAIKVMVEIVQDYQKHMNGEKAEEICN
jgi:hypothetical protein